MRYFEKILLLLSFLYPFFVTGSLQAANDHKTPQEKYIERYASIAVSEMYRTGVPASITLAQGILESGSGLSSLARKSNNHFGIKCHGWKGRKVYHDDDARGECFRAYDHPEESFRDHSDFLRYRDRYKFLFDYKTTDYKAWAKGLKKAGYATDPHYADKLIKYIEDYDLSRFDKMSSRKAKEISEAEKKEEMTAAEAPAGEETVHKLTRKERRALRKAEREAKREAKKLAKEQAKRKEKEGVAEDVIPESPLSIEKPKIYQADETLHFNMYRQIYSRNGVPYINAMEGETLESIAEEYDLFIKEICKFNDLQPGTEIHPGDIVYIQAKKKQGARHLNKYIVDHDGESLWAISQRFGVRLKEILKMNELSADYQTREGDVILLRK